MLGETGVRHLLRSEGRAEVSGNRTVTAAVTLTLMNRAHQLHQHPIPQLPDAGSEPNLMPFSTDSVLVPDQFDSNCMNCSAFLFVININNEMSNS